MAFPTTSVLTNFTRADEDPLANSEWAGPIQNGLGQLKLVSNAAMRSTTGSDPHQSYWSVGTFGADTEVFATAPTFPASTHGIAVWARIANPGNATTAAAYLGAYTNGTGWRVYKMTGGGTFAQVGSTDATAASNGDKLGLEIIGTAIKLYHYTGGAWNTRVSSTDATISAAGYIGAEVHTSTVATLDDFGGGTVVVAATGPPVGSLSMLGVGR